MLEVENSTLSLWLVQVQISSFKLFHVPGVYDSLFSSHAFLIVSVANKVVSGPLLWLVCDIKITVSVILIRLLHNTGAC